MFEIARVRDNGSRLYLKGVFEIDLPYMDYNFSINSRVVSPKKETPIVIDERYYIKRDELTIIEGEYLGEGGAASLLKGRFCGDNVAIKRYSGKQSAKTTRLLEQEACMLLSLQHPNIVQCFGLCKEGILALVLEQAGFSIKIGDDIFPNHSLRDLLDNYEQHFPFYKVGLTALHQVHNLYINKPRNI